MRVIDCKRAAILGKRKSFNLDSLRDKVAMRGSGSRAASHGGTSDDTVAKLRKPSFFKRKINEWGGRLLGAVSDGSFSGQQEEYATHRTSQDYIWNTAGLASWGIVFPLLTIVATQLSGVDQAGMFSLAFVAGSLLMIVANYGVRTYQVSDIDETHSFTEYQVNRWITCAFMLLVGLAFCTMRGYDGSMFAMTVCVFVYKMVDGLADVYEGRLQQMDKLYLAGVSQMIRSLAVLVVFTLVLLVTRSLEISSGAMAVAAILSFIFFTFPLALLETPKSKSFHLKNVGNIFVQCFPLFAALFLYAFIDNMPKFMMEGTLGYDSQLYFNALYFPAQAILLTVGFMYKPLLVRMAEAWQDLSRRGRFDLFIVVILLIIAAITAIGIVMMGWVGIPIMGFLYGLDFSDFTHLAYMMLVAGGITGGIDFLYQVMTVMRRQKVVTKLYLITFVFALFIPWMLIRTSGLQGAVMGYLIVMAVLFVLLALEYIGARVNYRRHPEDDPLYEIALARAGGETEPSGLDSAASQVVRKPERRMGSDSGASASAQEYGEPQGNAARQAAHRERMARETGEMDPETRARKALSERRARRETEQGSSKRAEGPRLPWSRK
jgi:O-antigen/teichoic acid export membrane protein